MTEQEKALLEQAKRGDAEAFRLLLEAHYDMIYRVAWRFTGHKQDAEDVAQEVCLALADKIGGFRGNSRFSTWLYRVVVNSCRDYQKKHGNRRSLEQRYVEVEEAVREEEKESQQQLAWLYRELAGLGEDLRETALLVLAEDVSHADAAEILGCSEGTVSWRMHKIRETLKQKLEQEHE